MKFEILKKSKTSRARAGILHTNHGVIQTPAFMPVGTQGSVKALTWEMMRDLNAQVVLGNTYHLAIRPGVELIREFGGLHQFTGWDKPILTDSGGYQVFSLNNIRKIYDDGVEFRSHVDGSKHYFTPESVVETQLGFNSDILMPLDICSSYANTHTKTLHELQRTTLWEQKAKTYWEAHHKGNLLFGIIQGGFFKDLRERSAKEIIQIDFPGYAIGGVSVGEPFDLMDEMIAFTSEFLPEDKPRYLMGVGFPENFDFAIAKGIDLFDCVIPTRLARHGQVFTKAGRINITNKPYTHDQTPLDPACSCFVCQKYSKAYLRHLMKVKEISGIIYLSYHNVYFLLQYVEAIRNKILEN